MNEKRPCKMKNTVTLLIGVIGVAVLIAATVVFAASGFSKSPDLPKYDAVGYEDVIAAPWFDFTFDPKLTELSFEDLEPIERDAWTREAVYEIPERDWEYAEYIGVFGACMDDDGFWNAGIRYQPASGIVSSANPGLFPLRATESTPVPGSGYVHFLETFDGTEQRVYVNGTLAYSAVSSGALSLSGENSQLFLMLNGYAFAGMEIDDAVDQYAEYGVALRYMRGYTAVADESAAKGIYDSFANLSTTEEIVVLNPAPDYASVLGEETFSLNFAERGGLDRMHTGLVNIPNKVSLNSYTKISAYEIPDRSYPSGAGIAIAALGDTTGITDCDTSVYYDLNSGKIHPLSQHFVVTESHPVRARGYVQFVEVFSGYGDNLNIKVYVNGAHCATLKVSLDSAVFESYFKSGIYRYLYLGTTDALTVDSRRTLGVTAYYAYYYRDVAASSAQVARIAAMATSVVTIHKDFDGNIIDPLPETPDPIPVTGEPVNLTVMEFNVLAFHTTDETEEEMVARGNAVAAYLRSVGADIMGLCEVNPYWVPYLRQVEGYEFYGRSQYGHYFTNDDPLIEESRWHFSNTIMWKKDRFNAIKEETFWVSDTPDNAGTMMIGSMKINAPSMVGCVILQERATGAEFVVATIHLPAVAASTGESSSKAREAAIAVILKEVNARFGDLPILLMGDWNCKYNSNPYNATIKAGFTDARLASSSYDNKASCSAQSYSAKPIDQLFYRGNFKALKQTTYRNFGNFCDLSDHCPTLFQLILNPKS